MNLHRFIKVPLVFMTWSLGLMIATNLVLAKTFGEIILSHVFWKMPVLAGTCWATASIGCLFVVYVLSLAMRYYDNIDAIPMF